MGDVAEGVRVGFGVGSFFKKVSVASVFTLAEKGATEPPNSRIKPVKHTDDVSHGGHPEVAPLHVSEFMKECHF